MCHALAALDSLSRTPVSASCRCGRMRSICRQSGRVSLFSLQFLVELLILFVSRPFVVCRATGATMRAFDVHRFFVAFMTVGGTAVSAWRRLYLSKEERELQRRTSIQKENTKGQRTPVCVVRASGALL